MPLKVLLDALLLMSVLLLSLAYVKATLLSAHAGTLSASLRYVTH